MGTSTEGVGEGGRPQGNTESPPPPPIPWKFVRFETEKPLVRKLNIPSIITGNDWRMLASKLGYNMEDLGSMEADKQYSNAEALFRDYRERPGSSVQEVLTALVEMSKTDCVNILRAALPEIASAWQQSPEGGGSTPGASGGGWGHHMAETRELPLSQHSLPPYPHQSPYPYLYPGSSMCGCGHSFSSCLSNNHSSHMASCSNAGGLAGEGTAGYQYPPLAAHHSHPTSRMVHSPGVSMAYPPPSHMGHMSPGCGATGLDNMCRKLGNSSPQCQQHPMCLSSQYPRSVPHHGCHYGNKPAMMECQVTPHLQHHCGSCEGASCCLQDSPMSHPSPSQVNINIYGNTDNSGASTGNSNRQKMRRQISDECNASQMRSGDKRLRAARTIEMEVDGGSSFQARDRDNNLVPGPRTHSPQLLQHPTEINFTAPAPEMFRKTVVHEDYGISVKCEKNVDLSPREGSKNYCDYPKMGSFGDRNMSSPGYAVSTGGVVRECGFSAHKENINRQEDGGREDGLPRAKTSLQYLERLSAMPDRVQPTQEYKQVIAEQKIESEKRPTTKSSSKEASLDSHSSSSSSSSSSSKGGPSSTFPMRVKHKHHGRGGLEGGALEELSAMNNLKISVSVPKDLKPPVYRKAFRNIRVLVTYSNDDRSHQGKVKSLCKFLADNQFACCVDVSDTNQDSWRAKFYKADFILACITPGYIQEVLHTPRHNDNQSDGAPRLHTQFIFDLMHAEFLERMEMPVASSPRFIPLLFYGTPGDCVPPCMMDSPCYTWPSQYKDLAWMLSKPQERMRNRGFSGTENHTGNMDSGNSFAGDLGHRVEEIACN